MADVGWSGPFASTDLPAGERLTGWSNEADDGATGIKSRFADGNPAASVIWREKYGNQNYFLAQSRRLLLAESWTTGQAVDPTKVNTGTDFTARVAIYAIAGPLTLQPNARRGDLAPPQLSIRIRAKKAANNGVAALVRLYSVPVLSDTAAAWPAVHGASSASNYAEWSVTSTSYAASPGWHTDTKTITVPRVNWTVQGFPPASGVPDIEVMETYLVLASTADASNNGVVIAAIQVHEEAPGA